MNIIDILPVYNTLRKDLLKGIILVLKSFGDKKVKDAIKKSIEKKMKPDRRREVAIELRRAADALDHDRNEEVATILTDLLMDIE